MLICIFVFAYADCWFSHEAAQLEQTTLSYSWVDVVIFSGYTGVERDCLMRIADILGAR